MSSPSCRSPGAKSVQPAITDEQGLSTSPFPSVGIGASAGGLEACTTLLQGLSADTGMTFVLVQHLDPRHESQLTSLLARATTMRVQQVRNGVVVKPNHVYVIPPDADMILSKGRLRLTPRGDSRLPHAVDHFFASLAREQQSRAVGVILSGTGSDGAIGMKEIKEAGEITFDLLIYLTPPLQKQLISTFHYALNPQGWLVLGHSETVGGNTDLFELVDRKNKIFSKKGAAIRPFSSFATQDAKIRTSPARPGAHFQILSPASFQKEADLLVRRRHTVLTAGTLAEARALAGKQPIDLVNSDIGLPDWNGNDLMRELSQQYGLKGVALTGYGMEQDLERSRAAGFVAHLTKPVRSQALEKILAGSNLGEQPSRREHR